MQLRRFEMSAYSESSLTCDSEAMSRQQTTGEKTHAAVRSPPRNGEDDLSGYYYWSKMTGPNHSHLLIPRTERDNVKRFILGLRPELRERMLRHLEIPWEVVIAEGLHVERYVEVIQKVLAHEKSGTQIPSELSEQMEFIPIGELERERTRECEDHNLPGYQYWSAMAGPNHGHLLIPQTKLDSVHRFIFGLRSNIRVRMFGHLESPWEDVIAEVLRVEKYLAVIQQVLGHEKAGTEIPKNLRQQMQIIPVGELERERGRAM
uniref:uncharacterized protein LOC105352499 n=1 Tax=Fragaria vesca subsp. vesca TaxID=101020 RepID=UPI0005CA980C|nr:PREDICTED: uncharacterized protein LOC105352499 [Fragaria vesca subsp. vesca]